jgi:hypothetical protein
MNGGLYESLLDDAMANVRAWFAEEDLRREWRWEKMMRRERERLAAGLPIGEESGGSVT